MNPPRRQAASVRPIKKGVKFTITGALTVLFSFLLFLSCIEGQARDPASAPGKNLLRNSRLVAGLPSGWTITGYNTAIFSEGDDVSYETDNTVKGPSGYPAFLVNVKNAKGVGSSRGRQDSVYLYTEPFRVERAGPYTASVSIKGSGEGVMGLVSGTIPGSPKTFAITAEEGWKRIDCQFQGGPSQKLYGLQIKFKGKIWFDGFQVNEGDKALPYASQYPAEVALAPEGSGELDAARMEFEENTATVRWTVTGGKKGDLLTATVTDLDDASKTLPKVVLKGAALESGTWNYTQPGLNKLGQFRINAEVKSSDGAPESAENELVATRVRRPRYWGEDAPASPFGVHVEPVTNQLLMAKAFGMNWARLHDTGIQLMGWSYLEYDRDQWRYFDDELARYRKHHMEILGQLGTAPQWRSYASKTSYPAPHPDESVTATYFAPLSMAEYSDYVDKAVEHYKDQVQYFDMWNEPWLPLFYSVDFVKGEPPDRKRAAQAPGKLKGHWYVNSKEAPENFAVLQKTAFDEVKKIDPELKLVGLGTHGEKGTDGRYDGAEWTKRMAQAGGTETADIMGFHAYISGPLGFPGDAVDQELQEAFGPLGGVAKVKESGHSVWLTEGSPVARKTSSGFYDRTLPYRDNEDYWDNSDRVVRYLARFLSAGVDKVFLYSMGAGCYFNVAPRARVLNTQDERPHPTGVAAANLAWNLENTKFREAVNVSDNKATIYVFDGKNYTVALLMPRPDESAAVPKPKGTNTKVENIFGNPIKKETTKYTVFLRGPRDEIDALIKKSETPEN